MYSDIVLSFQNVVRLTANDAKPIARGLIIDLDVHQGTDCVLDRSFAYIVLDKFL